jgi:hypothetical protein
MQPVPKRTAVLVVHGMGLQRPLETVRGIVTAVWCATKTEAEENKIWLHPDRSGVDIDLPVISGEIRKVKPTRGVDFYELYWAHLMSETPALAVLLWLFELAQKGPLLKRNMQLVWGAAALFLVLMIFSTSMLVLKAIERLANVKQIHAIVFAPVFMFFIFFVLCAILFVGNRAWRFSLYSTLAFASLTVFAVIFLSVHVIVGQSLPNLASELLPTLVALLAVYLLMGKWGLIISVGVLVLSLIFEIMVRLSRYLGHLFEFKFQLLTDWLRSLPPLAGWLPQQGKVFTEPQWTISWLSPDAFPWSMTSPWCVAAACVILATYVVISVAFLQPYLGDAARYFRNAPSNVAVRREIRREAVSMLERLHTSGRYDRIVVVAHSLGTVIAYDMLRAFFSRIAPSLPTTGNELDKEIKTIEDKIVQFQRDWDEFKARKHEKPSPEELRRLGRNIVGKFSAISDIDTEQQAWLVTDFVTLGSPLAHARYLMCEGGTVDALTKDFQRRTDEGELPVCPPTKLDKEGRPLPPNKEDGPLTYARDDDPEKARRFHNNALFGLTRWTNLYFRVSELFRGDAIGGPLEEIFGGGIIDVALPGHTPQDRGVTAHIRYWDVSGEDPLCKEHIKYLRRAIDLRDGGLANALSAKTPAQTVSAEPVPQEQPGELASPV